MTDPFLAEIKIFAGNFAPSGWAKCNGQLIPISQNTALFSLLGTYYGGDGKTNFALPNLQNSAPLQQGQGSGLSDYREGDTGGESQVTLLESEIPAHLHQVKASTTPGTQVDPNGMTWGVPHAARGTNMYTATQQASQMNPGGFSVSGNDLPHNNMMPFLALTFIIAMQGVYPSRP
jgi:microcystin-dependent protein